MSRELLKKCRAAIEVHCVTHDQEAKRSLLAEIDAELAKHDPKPRTTQQALGTL